MSSALEMSLDDLIKRNRKSRSGKSRGRGRGSGPGPARRFPNRGANRSAPYAPAKVPETTWQQDMFSDKGAALQGLAGRNSGIETGTKLYISNLDYGVSNDDIKELFSEVGDLKRFSVHYDRSGRSKGTADIVFTRRADALAAVKRYNNVELDGKPMKIEIVGTNIATPLSLFCALLLCLPLAVIITITSPTTTVHDGSGHNLVPDLDPPPKTQQRFSSKPLPLPLHDDDSLFRVASRVNSKLPPGSPKKIAFLFLTISPLPFAPLWELYFNQTPKDLFNVYVHADPSYPYDPPFSGVFAHRVIPSKPALRFTPTLASAARRLLAHALLHDRSNYMFVLLSASCIPIHSFDFAYKTLTRSTKSFIEILNNEVGSYDRWAARGKDSMLPEVTLEDFRIGSQFWSLTRKHAKLVVGDEVIWAKFNQPCVVWDTCYPEENYFPTLIHMRDPRGAVPATLTHVDWNGSFDGHPRMYVESEIGPQLISRLRKDEPRYGDDGTYGSDSPATKQRRRFPFLFARKFSPESIQPLLRIANGVVFKD